MARLNRYCARAHSTVGGAQATSKQAPVSNLQYGLGSNRDRSFQSLNFPPRKHGLKLSIALNLETRTVIAFWCLRSKKTAATQILRTLRR